AAISSSLTTLALAISLSGTGIQSHLFVTPSSLSFGDTFLGGSTSLTLSITNNGTAAVSGMNVSTSGDYTIQKPCPVATLAPGGRCDLTIVFTPKAAGTRTAALRVASSDPGSPFTVVLNGNGVAPKSFAFTVDGSTASTLKLVSGQAANYHLALAPQNGFIGNIVLNCTPVQAAQYATCSLLPSTVSVTGASAQTSTATLNTVMKVTAASVSGWQTARWAVLLLPFALLWTRRAPRIVLFLVLFTGATILASGCGSGGTVVINQNDPNLRYTPPGTYRYKVTASSVSGTPISQTIALTLVVTKP
ncbi:MAG TPA: choice-of-anchor D domain-containing protein, partial [Edaphobacter sp.]|nr:choice-of-anchor D domain-containing protein [Edaphobacter sp.]